MFAGGSKRRDTFRGLWPDLDKDRRINRADLYFDSHRLVIWYNFLIGHIFTLPVINMFIYSYPTILRSPTSSALCILT